MQLRRLLPVLAVVSSLVSSCAQPNGPTNQIAISPAPSADDLPPMDAPAVDWDYKCPGDTVTTFARESTGLAYDVYAPKNLGAPIRMRVCPPEDQVSASQLGGRAAVLIYDHDVYGRVIVEQYPYTDAEDFSVQAARVVGASNPGPGVHLEIVKIRGGLTAILTTNETRKPARSNLIWVERGLWFFVLGPTLSKDQALVIAEGA